MTRTLRIGLCERAAHLGGTLTGRVIEIKGFPFPVEALVIPERRHRRELRRQRPHFLLDVTEGEGRMQGVVFTTLHQNSYPPTGRKDNHQIRIGGPGKKRAWMVSFRGARPATTEEILQGVCDLLRATTERKGRLAGWLEEVPIPAAA